MSIRMLAVELYRIKKEVEALEKKLKASPMALSERNDLEQQLRKARAEEARLKGMLEGAKDS